MHGFRFFLFSISVLFLAQMALADSLPVVTFKIPPGQGRAPWNTPETAVKMKLGQTLRILNLDSTGKHALHAFSEPCPHGGDRVYDAEGALIVEGHNLTPIPLGGWAECDFDSLPKDPEKGFRFYNHFAGPSAPFYVEMEE